MKVPPTKAPILFLIFRRPDTTARVFQAIRQARPTQLFVAADGPRPANFEEAERCRQTREIIGQVDWPCEVKTLFRDQNIGVRKNVSEALTWFFSQVEEGIILEDDCLPEPDFFLFCELNLERFRHDTRVLQVSGTNFQPCRRTDGKAFFYSRYGHVWGWATWRRAWERYRSTLVDLESFFVEARARDFWDSRKERRYWEKILPPVRDGKVDSWAYRWQYTLWREGGLCLYPEANLVSNIGFGAGATHTQVGNSRTDQALRHLVHWGPADLVLRNREADRFTFERMYWGTNTERNLARVRKVKRLLKSFLC